MKDTNEKLFSQILSDSFKKIKLEKYTNNINKNFEWFWLQLMQYIYKYISPNLFNNISTILLSIYRY